MLALLQCLNTHGTTIPIKFTLNIVLWWLCMYAITSEFVSICWHSSNRREMIKPKRQRRQLFNGKHSMNVCAVSANAITKLYRRLTRNVHKPDFSSVHIFTETHSPCLLAPRSTHAWMLHFCCKCTAKWMCAHNAPRLRFPDLNASIIHLYVYHGARLPTQN